LSQSINLIVGLGNPGNEYIDTRHNAGFWFLDELAKCYQAHFKVDKKFFGETARVTIKGEDVWLLKPTTFMNLSGQALQALAQFYKIKLENILVVHDELDLEPLTARLKKGGGHGGHNGLRDISARMGKDFWRLRLGIGHPGDKNKVSGYVLSKASKDDRISIERAIDNALRVVDDIVVGDMQKAMNTLHSDVA